MNMRVKTSQFAISMALVVGLAFGASNAAYAQRGHGGGHGGGGHPDGSGNVHVGGANVHVDGRGNVHVSPNNANVGGGQVQGSVSNRPGPGNNNDAGSLKNGQSSSGNNGNRNNREWNDDGRTTGNQASIYGYPSGYRYSSGYRGYAGYPYGGFGLGSAYGPYGYGYFPWYGGLGPFGGLGGLGRIFGNGIYGSGYYNNGYYGGYSGYGGTTVYQQPAQPQQPAEDYVPQVNTTRAKLAAGATGNAVLGVTIDPDYSAAAVIRRVAPGGPVEMAGLRPGDMIASINERVIQSPNDVLNLVASMRPGEQVDIQFVRPIPRSQVKAAAPEVQPGASVAPAASESLPPSPPTQQPTPAS